MKRIQFGIAIYVCLMIPNHLLQTVYAIGEIPLSTPEWAKKAIWYQIFVERFRNGDESNDPTLDDMAGSWPHERPEGWRITPWTHDWYEQEDWAKKTGEEFYHTVQLRRYGGDLQGVMDKLDYLQDLGITALYFNPLNDAPSLHKYDARNYRHIDRNFGPDPRGDVRIIDRENPTDPATWRWTAADSLFLELIDAVHDRGMRLIVDYSWNHTGIMFWAWRDLVENQRKSPFSDWYQVVRFDDPNTVENEFRYRGWAGVRELPNLKKVGVPVRYNGGPVEGDLHPGVKAHVLHVTNRWLDPNGDGDPSDGVDGFRLDVAEMVPLGFWRDYRDFVKSVNPNAYLVGEVWWERWPDRMMDPRPYLGDIFDGIMNYRWYMPTRSLFCGAPPYVTPTTYVAHIDSVERGITMENILALMNVAASHDSPRLATSLFNPGRYKVGVKPSDNPTYRVNRPDCITRNIQKMLLIQQFTYRGAAHIWYGDEVGMWGADDPDCRKPMVWGDLKYRNEQCAPFGIRDESDTVTADSTLFEFYRTIISVRNTNADLFVYGTFEVLQTDDESGIFAYARRYGNQEAIVLFNISDTARSIRVPVQYTEYYDAIVAGEPVVVDGGYITCSLESRTAKIVLNRESAVG